MLWAGTLWLALTIGWAHAAPPTLVPTTESVVTVAVPEGWKLLTSVEQHNITMSADITTTLTLYWLPYRWVPPDAVLNVLVKTVNEQLPVGELEETKREPLPGFEERFALQRGRLLHGEVNALGYTMKVASAALVDEAHQRVVAAFLLAPPETYAQLDGANLLADVVGSFHLASDPLLPVPGWWWGREVPAALRAPATAAP